MATSSGDGRSGRLPLTRTLSSPAAARCWVGERLREWQVSRRVTDDCLLVTSELVTNAVVHGNEPIAISAHLDSGSGQDLTIEVSDAAPDLQRTPTSDPFAQNGRGLDLVAASTDRWYVARHRLDGKTVVAVWHDAVTG